MSALRLGAPRRRRVVPVLALVLLAAAAQARADDIDIGTPPVLAPAAAPAAPAAPQPAPTPAPSVAAANDFPAPPPRGYLPTVAEGEGDVVVIEDAALADVEAPVEAGVRPRPPEPPPRARACRAGTSTTSTPTRARRWRFRVPRRSPSCATCPCVTTSALRRSTARVAR